MSGNHQQKTEVNELLSMKENIVINQDEDVTVLDNNDQEMDKHDGDNNYFNDANIDENYHDKSRNKNNDDDIDVDDNINVYDNLDNDCHLQQAIRNNKDQSMDDILELLKNYPMEVQHQNKLVYYPLHTACKYRSFYKVVILLIELFPKAAQCKTLDGQYPLHFVMMRHATTTSENAVHQSNKRAIIAKLIEMNPLVLQEKNYDKDEYLIHRAIIEHQPIAIVKLLLDGDPLGMERRTGVSFRDGSTPFHLACKMNDTNLVQYLLQRSDLQINIRDSAGKTPLHHACNHRREEMVEMILRHPDIDVNAIDTYYDDTPLHITLRYEVRIYSGTCIISSSPPESYVNIIQKLLNHPFILINEKNKGDNKIPLEIIQDRVNELKNRINNLTSSEKVQLQCYLKMIHSLKEFTAKQRWQSYCYHSNMFKDL